MGLKQAGHQGRPLVSTIRPTRLCLKPHPDRPIFFKPRHAARHPFQGGLHLRKIQLNLASSRS